MENRIEDLNKAIYKLAITKDKKEKEYKKFYEQFREERAKSYALEGRIKSIADIVADLEAGKTIMVYPDLLPNDMRYKPVPPEKVGMFKEKLSDIEKEYADHKDKLNSLVVQDTNFEKEIADMESEGIRLTGILMKLEKAAQSVV